MGKREPTTIMVTTLDLSSLNAEAFAAIPKDGEYKEATGCRCREHGIVQTKRGLYALDTEGIGPSEPISAKNTLPIEFWAEAKSSEGYTKGWVFPAVSISLDDADLNKLATNKTVNLADFIRGFGARLNRNYEEWRRELEAAQK